MMQSPKSLTATIHVRFDYAEPEAKPEGESKVEMINSILDRASELEPCMLETLLRFASYLAEDRQKEAGQSPG